MLCISVPLTGFRFGNLDAIFHLATMYVLSATSKKNKNQVNIVSRVIYGEL